jgi:hypothetical protein
MMSMARRAVFCPFGGSILKGAGIPLLHISTTQLIQRNTSDASAENSASAKSCASHLG